jgi:hypothetical protein
MRSLALVGFVVVVALGASSAWAQTDTKTQVATPAGDAKKVAVKNPDEVICIHQTSIDSRIPGPAVCRTRRVWDALSDQARRDTQDLQQRSLVQSQKGG